MPTLTQNKDGMLDTKKGEAGTINRNYSSLTSQDLTTQPSLNVTQPKPATEAAGMLGYMDAFTQSSMTSAKERQSVADDSFQTYLKSALTADTETGMQDKLYSQNVDPLQKDLDDINSQILAEQHALRRQVEAIRRNEQGAFGGAVEDMVQEAERESLGKQADLAVIQLSRQGKYDSAKAIADRAVKAMFEKQQNKLEALKFNYQENKDLFTTAEQRAFELAQGDREMKLQEEKDMRMARFNLTLDKELANYQNSLKGSGADAPTVKTINGVDVQWNPATGTWEPIDMGGGGPEQIGKSVSQLDFILSTAKTATGLADASGASGLSKMTGDWLIGDTPFRQLEAYTNTLRTNMLTLATDPAIKKFFGPQMSNADVQLMTSAGTTLNPDKQTPAQMKEEIARIEDFVTRAKAAVTQGMQQQASTENTITAPDGTQIIITD